MKVEQYVLEDARLTQATESVAAKRAVVANDGSRPVFHFRPPAMWMNDPNGLILHNGYYHLFYQHNPYADTWGTMHWGHARSRDLVNWEHLPIALGPSKELGEEHCFSGCCTLNGNKEPVIFYTSVLFEDGIVKQKQNEQWAAFGDQELVSWQKHPSNPILKLEPEQMPQFDADWRDPFVFTESGRTFMILGATLNDEAVIPIFEADEPGLMRWIYRGILFSMPKKERAFLEVPNLFRIEDKWALIVSACGPPEYFIGDLDLNDFTFTASIQNKLDFSENFYAPSVLIDETGQPVILAWIQGFEEGRGWNGCMSLPRVLKLSSEDKIIQTPLEQLKELRQEAFNLQGLILESIQNRFFDLKCETIEFHGVFEVQNSAAFTIRIGLHENAEADIVLFYEGQNLNIFDSVIPVGFEKQSPVLEIHFFLDKTVFEMFVNGGETVFTNVLKSKARGTGVEVSVGQGSVNLRTVCIWQMKSIW